MTEPTAPAPAHDTGGPDDARVVPAPAADKHSMMDDLVDVLLSPLQVFTRQAKAPRWGGAFVLLSVIMIAVMFASRSLTEPIVDAQMTKVKAQIMAQNPQMTEEQAQTALKFSRSIGAVSVLVAMPVVILVIGLVVWLVGKLFDAQLDARQGMLIGTYAFVPRVIGALVTLGLSFVIKQPDITNAAQLTIGPGRFFDPATTGAVLLALLGRIDLFIIWGTIVIAAGYIGVGKLSKAQASLAAILVWVLGGIVPIFGALRGG